MSMTTSATIILAAMVAAYAAAKIFKISTELSMLAAALVGGLAGGAGIPARHIAEGAFTYLDICLIFITATLFMNLLKESGGVAFVVRRILKRFHRHKFLLFIMLAVLMLIPGMLTGAGSVTVLIVGGMVATVLGYMGIPKPKAAAIVFVIAGLSAAAPPVSLWAMLTAAGVNMPYVGFFLPLMIPCLLLALLTIFILGWKSEAGRSGAGLERASRAAGRDELAEDRPPLSRLFRPDHRRPDLAVRFPDHGPSARLRLRRRRHPPPLAGPHRFPRRLAPDGPSAPPPHRNADLRRRPCPDHDPDRRPRPDLGDRRHPAGHGRHPDPLPDSARIRVRADVGRGAGARRAARSPVQHDEPQSRRRPGRDERHLAARRRDPADGHHRPADRGDRRA